MLAELKDLIAKNLYDLPSTADLFNPYSTVNPQLDVSDAVSRRRSNLEKYIMNRVAGPRVFLLAEAPGPWGCRFTGVPITSEAQLVDPDFPASGLQTSSGEKPHTEYSATVYWRVLQPYYEQIFTWNTVPFHPHYEGKPLSIRTPRVSEVKRFTHLLSEMLRILRPHRVIAIGRKAEKALSLIDVEATYVRHPSQGGARLFEAGVLQILNEMKIKASDD